MNSNNLVAKMAAIGVMLCASMGSGAIAAPASAALSPINIPSVAAPLNSFGGFGWTPAQDVSAFNRWGGRGFGRGGFGRGGFGRRGFRRRGIGAGDVLAGALIIGGIVAIASAASNNNNERRYRRDEQNRDINRNDNFNRNNDINRNNSQNYDTSALNQAADQCSFAAEDRLGNGAQVDRINSIARDGNGWRVEGTLRSDQGIEDFQCGVTGGNIEFIQLGR